MTAGLDDPRHYARDVFTDYPVLSDNQTRNFRAMVRFAKGVMRRLQTMQCSSPRCSAKECLTQ